MRVSQEIEAELPCRMPQINLRGERECGASITVLPLQLHLSWSRLFSLPVQHPMILADVFL